MDARMILLPLKSDLGDVSRALGCLVCLGPVTATPRRFDVLHNDLRPIIPGSGPIAAAPAVRPAPASTGFAAPAAPFDERDRGKRRPPYLRLVKSDK